MSANPADRDIRPQRRLMSALAVALLLVRILLPMASDGVPAVGRDGGAFHAGPALAHIGHADAPDQADPHHEICHFCRFQDAALPPPTSEPVARTLPPVAVPWRSSVRQTVPLRDFLIVVQARAPPPAV